MRTRRWGAAAVVGLILGLVPTVSANASEPVAKPAAHALSTRVHFTNRYLHQVEVVVATKDSSCSGWLVKGWWLIDSGDSAWVTSTDESYFLYYAKSTADDHNWSGGALDVNVPLNRFATCDTYLTDSGPSTRAIGMRLKTYSAGSSDFTVTLIP